MNYERCRPNQHRFLQGVFIFIFFFNSSLYYQYFSIMGIVAVPVYVWPSSPVQSLVFLQLSFAARTGRSFGAPYYCWALSARCGGSSQSLTNIAYNFVAGLTNPETIGKQWQCKYVKSTDIKTQLIQHVINQQTLQKNAGLKAWLHILLIWRFSV